MAELGINWKLLMAQLINFLLFFVVYKKYIAKPFLKYMREQQIKEKANEQYEKKLEEIKAKEAEILAKARTQAEKESIRLIKQTKESAAKLKEKLIKDMKKEVEEERQRLLKQIDQEREELERDLKEKVYTLALKISEESLQEFLDEQRKKEYTRYLLKNLEKIKA